ncbi:hypothetical protein ACPD8N_06950 [Lacticaseibacillus chiayiensis]|uniref:hypothetical protein n=1 Tax=Lacticaseibacillus chiayiensis TaxID=2100821 RepID=UPI003C7358D0
MISEEVERRLSHYYMQVTMSEAEYLALGDALVEKIDQTNDQVTEDELVYLGVKIIKELVAARETKSNE